MRDPDLYVVNDIGDVTSNALLLNEGGTFTRLTHAGVEGTGWTMGIGVVDLDRDGCLDAVVLGMSMSTGGSILSRLPSGGARAVVGDAALRGRARRLRAHLLVLDRSAFVFGLGLGALYESQGGLLAPIIMHFINPVNIRMLGRRGEVLMRRQPGLLGEL